VKFKTKRKSWNGPSPKSNLIYLENYKKIFKGKEKVKKDIKKAKHERNIYEQFG
jgi:hypothetical protein